MRVVANIDQDVAAAIERIRVSRNSSLEAVVNDLLRAGLARIGGRRQGDTRYSTRAVDLGRSLVDRLDSCAGAIADGEGEAFP